MSPPAVSNTKGMGVAVAVVAKSAADPAEQLQPVADQLFVVGATSSASYPTQPGHLPSSSPSQYCPLPSSSSPSQPKHPPSPFAPPKTSSALCLPSGLPSGPPKASSSEVQGEVPLAGSGAAAGGLDTQLWLSHRMAGSTRWRESSLPLSGSGAHAVCVAPPLVSPRFGQQALPSPSLDLSRPEPGDRQQALLSPSLDLSRPEPGDRQQALLSPSLDLSRPQPGDVEKREQEHGIGWGSFNGHVPPVSGLQRPARPRISAGGSPTSLVPTQATPHTLAPCSPTRMPHSPYTSPPLSPTQLHRSSPAAPHCLALPRPGLTPTLSACLTPTLSARHSPTHHSPTRSSLPRQLSPTPSNLPGSSVFMAMEESRGLSLEPQPSPRGEGTSVRGSKVDGERGRGGGGHTRGWVGKGHKVGGQVHVVYV